MLEEYLDKPLREVLGIMQRRSFQSTYFGVGSIMCPTDFWVYQEIIYRMLPNNIVEIGNEGGGTLLAFAHILDNINHPVEKRLSTIHSKVIGVDIDHSKIPDKVKEHPRIELVTGDACEVFDEVKERIKFGNTLVIEDSAHTYENTLNVLRTYSPLTSVGDYFIVEDSICHHGLPVGPHPGPYEAIEAFVKESDSFEVDRDMESFLITWNPKGYLKRVK